MGNQLTVNSNKLDSNINIKLNMDGYNIPAKIINPNKSAKPKSSNISPIL